MEKGMDIYVRKLIELDSTAVELLKKRESETAEMEAGFKKDLQGFENMIEEASLQARKIYDEIIEEARSKVKAMDKQAAGRIVKLEEGFNTIKDGAAASIWQALLDSER